MSYVETLHSSHFLLLLVTLFNVWITNVFECETTLQNICAVDGYYIISLGIHRM